jgi:methylated-DNA-[protein]-cysteine S-methyltransferase
VETVAGVVRLAYSEKGLYELELPQRLGPEHEVLERVGVGDPAWVQQLALDLVAYFAGECVTFSAPLDDTGYPPFFRRVLAAAAGIPWGESRTYRWLALEADSPKAVRAAGGAMAANRTPVVIPCHRVLRSDGGLGGFSGGLDWKRTLLQLEKLSWEGCSDATN